MEDEKKKYVRKEQDDVNLNVTLNSSALDINNYNTTVVISSNDPDENPVLITVQLNVIYPE